MPRSTRFTLIVVLFMLLLSVFSLPQNVQAAYQVCGYSSGWSQVPTIGYAIIYPRGEADQELYKFALIVQDLMQGHMDAELLRFEQLLDQNLPRPLTIRVYPNSATYECFNPAANPISANQPHAHIGFREVAFIGPNLWETGEPEALNVLRFELAALLIEARTNGYAPPGFVTGIGGYAENPNEVFTMRYQQSGLTDQVTQSWQVIWENPAAASDAETRFLATSMVAFLIDAYGWDALLELLDSLAGGVGYREALDRVYGVGVAELQVQWAAYFPLYVGDRWQNHLFYSFDVSPYPEMIQAGAYSDAAERLTTAQPILTAFGQTEALAQVESLLKQADLGIQAGTLMTSARQALLSGEYQRSLDLANQAGAIYEILGVSSREEELRAYLAWADEVLGLRAEVAAYVAGEEGANPFTPRRLTQIGERLGELGDEAGLLAVQQAVAHITRRQWVLQVTLLVSGSAIVLVLLIHRILLIWQRPTPPEADLL